MKSPAYTFSKWTSETSSSLNMNLRFWIHYKDQWREIAGLSEGVQKTYVFCTPPCFYTSPSIELCRNLKVSARPLNTLGIGRAKRCKASCRERSAAERQAEQRESTSLAALPHPGRRPCLRSPHRRGFAVGRTANAFTLRVHV